MPRAALAIVAPVLAALLGCRNAGSAPPVAAAAPPPEKVAVAALGRIQPKGGVRRIAGPARSAAVIKEVLVEPGDAVRRGQRLAVLEDFGALQAEVAQLEAVAEAKAAEMDGWQANLRVEESERRRTAELYAAGLVSAAESDRAAARVDVSRAAVRRTAREEEAARRALARAQVERDRAVVRSPIDGRVLKVLARAGEKVGEEGIAQLATSSEMYVVAEVYETDITRVKVGQRARVRSPLLPRELLGTVERLGAMVGKRDLLGTDPAARKDVRVVEVEIRLDDGASAADLINLQVDVSIGG
jgi:HlyD family secretion protein